jgi:hypothetical protein
MGFLNPIDQFFRIQGYEALLDKAITSKKTPEEIQAKAQQLFEQAICTDSNIVIEGDQNFRQCIYKNFKQILEIKPGRKLFKKIFSFNKPLNIHPGHGYPGYFGKGSLRFNEGDYPMLVMDAKGEIKEQKVENFTVLAHELIHYLHDLEGTEDDDESESLDLIHSRFDNLEEQVTICGVKKNENKEYVFHSLCQNVFHRAVGLDPCCSHRSENLDSLDLGAAAYLGIVSKVEEILKVNPKLVNQVSDFELGNAKLLPLTAAILSGDEALIEYLFESGADATLMDDHGGPLCAAVEAAKPMIAKKLVELGANPAAKIGGTITIIYRAFSLYTYISGDMQKQVGELIREICNRDLLQSQPSLYRDFPLDKFRHDPDMFDYLSKLYP